MGHSLTGDGPIPGLGPTGRGGRGGEPGRGLDGGQRDGGRRRDKGAGKKPIEGWEMAGTRVQARAGNDGRPRRGEESGQGGMGRLAQGPGARRGVGRGPPRVEDGGPSGQPGGFIVWRCRILGPTGPPRAPEVYIFNGETDWHTVGRSKMETKQRNKKKQTRLMGLKTSLVLLGGTRGMGGHGGFCYWGPLCLPRRRPGYSVAWLRHCWCESGGGVVGGHGPVGWGGPPRCVCYVLRTHRPHPWPGETRLSTYRGSTPAWKKGDTILSQGKYGRGTRWGTTKIVLGGGSGGKCGNRTTGGFVRTG